jgi:TolB protein
MFRKRRRVQNLARVSAGAVASTAVIVCCGSADAARPAVLQIGFVRGDSIFVASPAGTDVKAVLRPPRTRKSDPYYYAYSDPAWSRSGSLAVTETQSPQAGGHDYSSVLVVRPGRRRARLYGCGPNANDEPSWAPDGRRVAYRGVGGVCVARLGGGVRAVTTPSFFSISDWTPAWSPDGQTIAFARLEVRRHNERETLTSRIFLIRADGKAQKQLTKAQKQLTHVDSYNPSWSPDGRRIAFDDGGDLYVIKADGSGLHRLTSTPQKEFDPAWSPTGRIIAFVRRGAIWTLDLRTHRRRLLVRHATQPAWKTG